jgi:hypothetical protein
MPKTDRRYCLRECRRCGCVFFGRATFCSPECRELSGFRWCVPAPTPQQVAERAAAIRAEWSDAERASREVGRAGPVVVTTGILVR